LTSAFTLGFDVFELALEEAMDSSLDEYAMNDSVDQLVFITEKDVFTARHGLGL
jgi:hypothetical protein